MKRIQRAFSLVTIMVILTLPAFAQQKEDADKKKEKTEKEQIIITRKGGDNEKIVIEIKDDKVIVNGKPLEDLKEGDITVRRNKIRSGDRGLILRSPGSNSYSFDWDDDASGFFRNSNQNMAFLGVSTEKADHGVRISEVSEGSAAEKAGLKKDDVITKVGDKKIADPDELSKVIREHKPGDKVAVTFLRDKKEQQVTAELGKTNFNFNFNFSPKIPDMNIFEDYVPRSPSAPRIAPFGQYWNWSGNSPRLGLSIQDTEDGKGVKVIDVDEDSHADKAGVKENDVITHFNDKEVNNVDEVSKLVKENKDKTSIMLKIKRNGKSQNIEVTMPRKLKTTNL